MATYMIHPSHMKAEFLVSASKPENLPKAQNPEIAFVGRSNCGKSTLINCVCQRQKLARTSATPGRTQLANFFQLNDKLVLIDLPGYGFSATGKAQRLQWQELVAACLKRPTLQATLFLMDVRRSLDGQDRDLLRYLSDTAPLLLVLTKTDKSKQGQVSQKRQALQSELASQGIDLQAIHSVSSLKKKGIDLLREQILTLADRH